MSHARALLEHFVADRQDRYVLSHYFKTFSWVRRWPIFDSSATQFQDNYRTVPNVSKQFSKEFGSL